MGPLHRQLQIIDLDRRSLPYKPNLIIQHQLTRRANRAVNYQFDSAGIERLSY